MKLIVGLGNPGSEYEKTRHNVGFLAVDSFANDHKLDFKFWGQGKRSDLIQGTMGSEKFILLKPLTFMNLSGHSAVEVAHFFKVLPEDICAIHDDLDLPFGAVRLKIGGGDGGHNGLKSLTKSLAGPDYARIRMGIGRPPHVAQEVHDYVLGTFANSDWPTVDDMIERTKRAIVAFISGDQAFKREMNVLNQKAK